MSDINNPHDKFFKEIFSHKTNAEEFLLNYLPGNIVSLFDLKSLEYAKESFVDKDLSEYFSDLLCKAYLRDGSRGYIYILFEHKSYQEPLAAFYMLRYMVRIWELWLKEEIGRSFPVIIPMVVYHGANPWSAGLNYKNLFNYAEPIAPFIPDFQYVLWDATGYSDEEIKGKVMLRVALLTMKYIFREDLREHLPKIFELLRDISEKRKGIELIETIIRYLLSAAPMDRIMYEDIKDAVEKSLSTIGGEIMPTIADSLIEQGSIKTARESVIDSLEVRFEVVPESLVKKINEISDPSILRILHRQAIKVKSMDEFTELIKSMLR